MTATLRLLSEIQEEFHQDALRNAYADGFKAGQNAMRERAEDSALKFRDSLTAHDERLAIHVVAERLSNLTIKESE